MDAVGIAFAAAPMCMYLIGAVNPNGAELAAAVAVWVGVLRLLETFETEPSDALISRTWLWAGSPSPPSCSSMFGRWGRSGSS